MYKAELFILMCLLLCSAGTADKLAFLITRFDSYLTDKDDTVLKISASQNKFYEISISPDGSTEEYCSEGGVRERCSIGAVIAESCVGTINESSDKDTGIIYEVLIDRSAISDACSDGKCEVKLELYNCDGDGVVFDTFTGANDVSCRAWPSVVIE